MFYLLLVNRIFVSGDEVSDAHAEALNATESIRLVRGGTRERSTRSLMLFAARGQQQDTNEFVPQFLGRAGDESK